MRHTRGLQHAASAGAGAKSPLTFFEGLSRQTRLYCQYAAILSGRLCSRLMSNPFFDHPILNSPYECPGRHWELDPQGQPTQQILEKRRRAEFITPIPKPKKRKASAAAQEQIVFDEGKGLSTSKQQYDQTSIVNELRSQVDQWRALPHPKLWQVTPETARLLQHWRHFKFSSIRPFFCQIEAVETAIWLTEVAPSAGKKAKSFGSPRSHRIRRVASACWSTCPPPTGTPTPSSCGWRSSSRPAPARPP